MNTQQQKMQALEERTVIFSVAVVRKVGPYANRAELRSMVDQVIRSATSIGANYAEANNASSKFDFKNKIYIAKKKLRRLDIGSEYWRSCCQKLI